MELYCYSPTPYNVMAWRQTSLHFDIFAPHDYYVANTASSFRKFRDDLSVPSSRIKKPRRKLYFWIPDPLKMGPIGCPEKSVKNFHYSLRNNPEERSSLMLRSRSLKSGKVYILLREAR